jgi:hypothetical protein
MASGIRPTWPTIPEVWPTDESIHFLVGSGTSLHLGGDMDAHNFLARLEHVKRTGAGRYLAKCPAHSDRSPSLTVRVLDDGRILVHCFSGCDVSAVVSALGLSLADLFPDQPENTASALKRELGPWYGMDVLRALRDELIVVQIAAEMMAVDRPLSPDDRVRLLLAKRRIDEAVLFVGRAHGK